MLLVIRIKAFTTTNELTTDILDELTLRKFFLLKEYSQVIDELLRAHGLVGGSLIEWCSRVLCCGGSVVKLCLVWCLEFHSHSLLYCSAIPSLLYPLERLYAKAFEEV